MGTAIMATEIFGVLIVGVIIYGTLFETKRKDKKSNAFVLFCVGVLFTILFDALTYFPYDTNSNSTLAFITGVAFVMPYVVYPLFLNYLYISANKKAKVSPVMFMLAAVYSIICIIVISVLSIMGKLYVIENGIYHPGELYDLYLILYLLVMVYVFILACVYMKKIGVHDAIAAMLFIVIPIIFIVINFFFDELAFGVSSLSIDVLLMNTMLQAQREKDLVLKEESSNKLAHRDELTGLPNRLAYNKRIDSINTNDEVGVLFCDVNGLKYVNDHYGHTAGDELIVKFADIAREFFKESDIYRISGDEFTIFFSGKSEKYFNDRGHNFKKKLCDGDKAIASVGLSYGNSSEIKRLMDLAERDMYTEKRAFHDKFPQLCRS